MPQPHLNAAGVDAGLNDLVE